MNSVLSPGVRVDVGAVVRDSIVMFDSVIRSGAVVDRAILDKEVVVGQGAIVGDGPYDDRPNKQEPGRLNTGITVVGKRAVVPRGARDRAQRQGRRRRPHRPTSSKQVIKSGESVEQTRRSSTAARHERDSTTRAPVAASRVAGPPARPSGARTVDRRSEFG